MTFEDMTHKFKQDGLRTLICSPVGCVQDLFEFHHFAKKIERFHRATGATVVIVTNDHRASHQTWPMSTRICKTVQGEVRKNESRQAQCPSTDNTEELLADGKKSKTYNKGRYNVFDEDIKFYKDQIADSNLMYIFV